MPQVLVALWAGIVRGDGLRTEGIFRLAGDPHACALAEKALVKSTNPNPNPDPNPNPNPYPKPTPTLILILTPALTLTYSQS